MAVLRRFAPLILAPTPPHQATASLIFLHGFGATADDWAELGNLPRLPYLRTILPQAPLRPIRNNGGAPMPAWFDILVSDHSQRTRDGTEDESGMNESLEDVRALIKRELELGIPPERIVVGGFSQGAGMALLAGLTGKDKVGGLVSLSGYLPLQWKFAKLKNEWADSVPTFVGHGTSDPVIRFEVGKGSADALRNSGLTSVDFHAYEGMQHGSCRQELIDLENWLLRTLPSLSTNTKL